MSEHESTVSVAVSAENAFRYLSSVSNLPEFVPHLRGLREDEPGHVFGRVEMEGRSWEASGFFRADEANRRLDWESDGTPGYGGWLQVTPVGSDQSEITVHLSILSAASEEAPPHPGLAGDRIQRELGGVMERMRSTLEQQARRAA
jgi:uncharacterized membrane protein